MTILRSESIMNGAMNVVRVMGGRNTLDLVQMLIGVVIL